MSSVPVSAGQNLRPVESPRGYDDISEDPIAALRRLDVFRALTEAELGKVARSAEVVRVPQDRVIPRAGVDDEKPAFCFVLRGKVAFAEFRQGEVPKPPANKKKRITPTMQLAKRVVTLFDVNDFFTNEHVPYARNSEGEKCDMALFTCVNVVLLKLPQAKMSEVLAHLPKIKEAIDVRAEESYYRQTLLKLEDRADIFDFYVREGFEYANAIKIIQTDKCIDCDECVKACEDRHGIARIERFGPRIGQIQFTLNCRTCNDARCIDDCNFDAIGYDDNHEVIVYDNCVGCTKCAKACPHEAIRMVDIKEELPPEEEEVDIVEMAKGPSKPLTVIAKGEEKKAKKKKPKRIANKCDHCFGFSDMACISACPTAAIIQIDPRTLFRRDGGYIDRADRFFETEPFELGFSQTTRIQGVRGMYALFLVATLGVLACAWEYFARRTDPSLSLWRLVIEQMDGPVAAARAALSYTPVTGLGRWLGYVGGGMMVVSALYTVRLNIPGLRRIGNSKTWFDFHVVFGLAGPVLAMLHTDFNIFDLISRPFVTVLWWAVTAIVLSGIVGRFLYTAIPKLEASVEKERKKLDEGIQSVADQWASMTVSANVLSQFLKAQEKTAEAAKVDHEEKTAWQFMWFLLQSEAQRIAAEVSLRFKTMGGMRNARLRRTTIKLMSRRSVIDRRMQFYGMAKRLLAQWRGIHIGISIIMFLLLIYHVTISVYAVGW